MRPFDFSLPLSLTVPTLRSAAETKVRSNPYRFGRDLIGALIVSTATFTLFWMAAMVTALVVLNRG